MVCSMSNPSDTWLNQSRREVVDLHCGAIPVVVSEPDSETKGTVLLVHGRNGAPDQVQITEIAAAYLARGWRVVAPELPNSAALPASGPPDRVTFSQHCLVAGAVWNWVASCWPGEAWALAGHSLGAFAAGHLAAKEQKTHHVLAVSPALSGRTLMAARAALGPEAFAELEREAPLYRLEMETADAAPALALAEAPLAVVTGAEDGIVPLEHARTYFTSAKNGRFFAALPGEHHCPSGDACAAVLAAALTALEA